MLECGSVPYQKQGHKIVQIPVPLLIASWENYYNFFFFFFTITQYKFASATQSRVLLNEDVVWLYKDGVSVAYYEDMEDR